MLNVIGESPVSDVESAHPSVLAAMTQLNRVSKELQTRGWWFNTETDLTLSPNELGQVLVPAGTLFIDPVDTSSYYVRRGNKLYDPRNHTFVLNTSVRVNVILQLDIEDLPESAAMFIMHKAAFDFYVNDDGDTEKSSRLEQRSDRAWQQLQSDELRALNTNARRRPQAAYLSNRTKQFTGNYNPKYPGGKA